MPNLNDLFARLPSPAPYSPRFYNRTAAFIPPGYQNYLAWQPSYTIGTAIGGGNPLYGLLSSTGGMLGNQLGRYMGGTGFKNAASRSKYGLIGDLLGVAAGYGLAHYLGKRNAAQEARTELVRPINVDDRRRANNPMRPHIIDNGDYGRLSGNWPDLVPDQDFLRRARINHF